MFNCEEFEQIQVQKVFELLRKRIVSENSPVPDEQFVFREIEQNFEPLQWFFGRLGYKLMGGNGYFYLSRDETKQSIENKLKQAYQWIDLIDFMNAFAKQQDQFFEPGFRFKRSDIEISYYSDKVLKQKLDNLPVFDDKQKTVTEKVSKVIQEFYKAGYVELTDQKYEKYLVLSSYNYLTELLTSIQINESDED